MQRRWKSLWGDLGKTPLVYGLFWLFWWHITWSPSLQPIFFSPKRRWNSHSHVIIFRKIFPAWRYLRSVYLTMKRSCSSSCVKEPELCWEVRYKRSLRDYTGNTSGIELEIFAINLVGTQTVAWAGRASPICSGCKIGSRALKAWRKSQAEWLFAVSARPRHVALVILIVGTTQGYAPTTGLWISHTGSPTLKQSSWKWKTIWDFTHL